MSFRRTYTKDGKTIRTKTYYFKITDFSGTARLFSTGITSKRDADALERRVRSIVDTVRSGQPIQRDDLAWMRSHAPASVVQKLVEIGAVSQEQIGARKHVSDHLDDYHSQLVSMGRTVEHADRTKARVLGFIDSIQFAEQITVDAVLDHLNTLSGRMGHDDANALTKKHHLVALKSFIAWMIEAGRLEQDPIRKLTPKSIKVAVEKDDRRRIHWPLTLGELHTLYWCTHHWAPSSGGRRPSMDGPTRASLYLFAAHTGLRFGAIRRLKAGEFDLSERACVHVPASADKARRKRTLAIIDPTLIEDLKGIRKTKLPSTLMFSGMPENMAKVIKRDLEHAGIAYSIDGVRTRDFHGLRATTATVMLQAGANIKTVQARLGHAQLNMTADVYTHAMPADEAAALRSAPAMKAEG